MVHDVIGSQQCGNIRVAGRKAPGLPNQSDATSRASIHQKLPCIGEHSSVTLGAGGRQNGKEAAVNQPGPLITRGPPERSAHASRFVEVLGRLAAVARKGSAETGERV